MMKESLKTRRKNQFILGDKDVTFNQFESHIRRMSGCRLSPIKIIYSFNCKAMSVYAQIRAQKDLIVMLYFHDMYNIGDDSNIRLGVDSSDGEDNSDYPPDI